jgi:DNA-binding CsgD family transcriptional regulator
VDERPLAPSSAVSYEQREEILDLSAAVQLRRREVADRLAAGRPVDAEVWGRGMADINARLLEGARTWREFRSLRPRITPAELRYTIPHSKQAVLAGQHMVSIFDRNGLQPAGVALLAAEDPAVFRLSVVPIQLKLVERDAVLLQGPFLGDDFTVMLVHDRICLAAAWRYWNAVEAASYDPRRDLQGLEGLTDRQCAIVGHLGDGATDEAIAAALGVSVRTVRYDVARILEALGVRSRFAAGHRIRELLGS